MKYDCAVYLATQVTALYTRFVVMKPWFNWLITAVVVANCAVLASPSYGMSAESLLMLNDLNFYCTIIFTVEMVMKLFALGFNGYLSDSFNVFDGFIVVISIVELFLPNGAGVSVFRSLRILRIIKLTQSFANFKRVITAILSVVPELANFFLLLLLFVFFFAVSHLGCNSQGVALWSQIPSLSNSRSCRP